VTLLGASTGFQSFAVIGNANTTYYTIAGQTGNQWEVGVGTYSTGATGATQAASPTSASWATDGSLVGSNITWYSASDTGYIVGDYVLLFDQTAGSSFFYYGQITLIQFAGGFGWSFSANIISSGGTPNGNPSSSWNMQESTGTVLARTTVLANSSATQPSALSFSAGTKDVFVTYPAGYSVSSTNNPGTSGQVLASNGTGVDPTWVAAPGPQAGGVIYENSLVISSNYTLTAGKNAMSVGPITISSGAAVTVPSGQRWIVF
jgi:hypothetical protein